MGRRVQLDELDALQSIFYSDEFQVLKADENEDIQVVFWVDVSLPEYFPVKYKDNLETEEYSYVKINYLPPMKLFLRLPEGYPSQCSPQFTISCQWLTKLAISKLCTQLDRLWCENENMEIIYVWVDFLKNESLKCLSFETELDISELYSSHLKYMEYKEKNLQEKTNLHEQGIIDKENEIPPTENRTSETSTAGNNVEKYKERRVSNVGHMNNGKQSGYRTSYNFNSKLRGNKVDVGLDKTRVIYDHRAHLNLNLNTSPLKLLLSYNAERENIEFTKKFFTCSICFTDKLGSECIKFENCNHVFCKSCIRDYFTVQINDGTVSSIKCPESNCTSDATPVQVKSLVSAELFAKYDSLLLKSALDSLDHVIYCPRIFCQYPATKDTEDNLAICPNCQYVFCIFCRMVYHGIEPCKFKSEEVKNLVDKYLNASAEVKEQMELRYGAKHIKTLVSNSMAEVWIESNCKNCPNCNVSIEKSQGCNKMVCWKCSTYFCWLCTAELDRTNPYSHYRDANSSCVDKLLYLVPVDDELDDYNSDDEQWRDWDWI